MNDQIKARDRECLSAYLDGALSDKATHKLELRLGTEATLAREMAQLERTRYLLRRAPQVRPPRAFTLTPEMAQRRNPWLDRLPVSLTMVSAMASMLLAIVLLGDFVTPGGIVSYSQSLPDTAAVAESAAADQQIEPLALKLPEEAVEEAEMDMAQEAPSEGALELPPNAGGGLEEETAEDQGERLIEEQVEQQPTGIRRLHLFLLYAVLALVALVSGLGAWLQRRLS